jgi:hypothetical protein
MDFARSPTPARRHCPVSWTAHAKFLQLGDDADAHAPARPAASLTTSASARAAVWDELYPAEQARILWLLIEGIDVAPDGISVTLHAAGIRSLVAELADQETPALVASEPLLEAAE